MKRKYIVAVLLFYVLTICTLFSVKIERSMMTQATAVAVNTKENTDIPITALFRDTGGTHLYYAEEGIAWLEGLRSQECDSNYYAVDHERQIVDGRHLGGKTIILSASRQPQSDERVNILQERQMAADRYLFLFTEEIPADALTNKILLQEASVFLTEEPEAYTPFFEHEVKNHQAGLAGMEYKVYSLNDAEQMARSLPGIVLVVALSLLPVLLLLFTCIAPQKGRILFGINLSLSVAVWVAVAFILSKIELPPSWMPPESILDFTHYRVISSQIKGTLETLQYDKTLTVFAQSETDAVWALITAGIVTLLAVGGEIWIWTAKRRNKQEK